jgi:hypothetical protein
MCTTTDTFQNMLKLTEYFKTGPRWSSTCCSCILTLDFIDSFDAVQTRERKRTEPNRTKTVRFGSSRTDPNSNRHFEKWVEPNRTRTGLLKIQSNRTELEPEDLGSVCVYGSSEFWKVILYTRSSALVSSKRVISWKIVKISDCQ